MTEWNSLAFTGLGLEPEYTPHKIKLKVKEKYIELDPITEEIITKFVKTNCHNVKDVVFKKNFIKSLSVYSTLLKVNIFEDMDFEKFRNDIKKRNIVPSIQENHSIYIDEKKKDNVNIQIEPMCIFKGRGMHPLRGCIKRRIKPCDITLNMSKNILNTEQKTMNWKQIICNKHVNWIATWKDPLTKKQKYIHFNNENKNTTDLQKFELARKLKRMLHKIRRRNDIYIKSTCNKKRQLALAIHLIDILGIRVGNEDDTTQTIGCCTLKKENITINKSTKWVTISFIGKDHVPFKKSIKLGEDYYKYLLCFKEFDEISPGHVNRYLNGFLDGMTAKVFRTCNACRVFEKELYSPNNMKLSAQKRLLLANDKTAKFCNHRTNNGKLLLTTSKKNYIDPRIVVAFCKNYNMNINVFYTDTGQIQWALSTKKDFKF